MLNPLPTGQFPIGLIERTCPGEIVVPGRSISSLSVVTYTETVG